MWMRCSRSEIGTAQSEYRPVRSTQRRYGNYGIGGTPDRPQQRGSPDRNPQRQQPARYAQVRPVAMATQRARDDSKIAAANQARGGCISRTDSNGRF